MNTFDALTVLGPVAFIEDVAALAMEMNGGGLSLEKHQSECARCAPSSYSFSPRRSAGILIVFLDLARRYSIASMNVQTCMNFANL